jgi:hypothetical protein
MTQMYVRYDTSCTYLHDVKSVERPLAVDDTCQQFRCLSLIPSTMFLELAWARYGKIVCIIDNGKNAKLSRQMQHSDDCC